MKKWLAAGLAALLAVGLTASAASPVTQNQPVVIANAWNAPDVGTAAALAARLGGTVLYANADSLGAPTVEALKRLAPSEIVLVGGTSALSKDVETALDGVLPNIAVQRLAGRDRIDTAAQAALYTPGEPVPHLPETTSPTVGPVGGTGADPPAALARTASIDPPTGDWDSNFYTKSFTVGADLLAGEWRVAGGDYTRRCGHLVNEDAVSGDWNAFAIVVNGALKGIRERIDDFTVRYKPFRLEDADVVTLHSHFSEICTIEWISE